MDSVPASVFFQIGSIYCNASTNAHSKSERRFRALYGTSESICSNVWEHLRRNLVNNSKPLYLLFAFAFLKIYATESIFHTIFKVDEDTFRKWSRYFVKKISEIPNVSFEKQYKIYFLSVVRQY